MNVRIVTLPERHIVRVRQTGPYKEAGTLAWKILCGWAGPKGLLSPANVTLGIGHDDPTIIAPENLRYDAAVTVEAPMTVEPPVVADILPGGEYAVTTHKGPYEELEETYKRIMGQWLPQSGREIREGFWCFEVYRNNPYATPPEELLTDVHVPLK